MLQFFSEFVLLLPLRSITKTVVNAEVRREIGENQKVHPRICQSSLSLPLFHLSENTFSRLAACTDPGFIPHFSFCRYVPGKKDSPRQRLLPPPPSATHLHPTSLFSLRLSAQTHIVLNLSLQTTNVLFCLISR